MWLTPSDNTKAIDHGSVRVSADHTVWEEVFVCVEYDPSQVLQVHLMDDTWSRRYY